MSDMTVGTTQMTVGCIRSNMTPPPVSGILEALLEQKERQLEKARKALMMCIAPDPEAERLKEEVLLEQ
jgi:hypothetical protein